MKTLNRILTGGLVAGICFVLVGCDSNAMMERFKGGEVRILVDKVDGQEYAVRHNVLDSYFITPIAK